MELQSKTAFITGASRGIGRALALDLASQQMNLGLAARTEQDLRRVAAEVKDRGGQALILPTDMRDERAVQTAIDVTVQQFGALHVLINNAGLGHFKPIGELTLMEWDEMFDVNLRGVFVATRAALSHLRSANESFVVNIASLAGKNTFVGGGGYASTKWALRAFSQCLLLEERKQGVRVLSVCPGSVDTSFSPHTGKKDMIRPEDVAVAVRMALQMPQHTMVSEIDLRPTNP